MSHGTFFYRQLGGNYEHFGSTEDILFATANNHPQENNEKTEKKTEKMKTIML